MVFIRRDWYKTRISVGSHGNPDTVILQWSHFVDNTGVFGSNMTVPVLYVQIVLKYHVSSTLYGPVGSYRTLQDSVKARIRPWFSTQGMYKYKYLYQELY